ncbi:MAG: hypothetical protein EXS09_01600 [Gemmataceae bacterium]|nr:hypothetical protein [Gemmataceae bacterium]
MLRNSLCLCLIASPLWGQTPDVKKATIRFLASLQQPDGGFVPAPPDPKADAVPVSSLRATSAAVRGIKYLGGEVPNAAKAMEFVQSCYHQDSGAFSDTPKGKEDVNVTAVGMMATAEVQKLPSLDKSIEYLVKNAKTFEERRLAVAGMESAKKFAPEVKAWLAEVEKSKNPDGTFGSGGGQARDTGGIAAMMLRTGNNLDDQRRKTILDALRAGQRTDGGFGKDGEKASDPETTYRVMRAFYLLGEKPSETENLRDYLKSWRNADGGYGVGPGKPSNVSGTYYAVTVLRWLDK